MDALGGHVGRIVKIAAALAAAVSVCAISGRPAAGDIFHLAGGGLVEGEEVGREKGLVRIRTRQAQVTLAEGEIVSIDRSPLSWKTYEKLRREYPDTADSHYRLGLWCRQHKLEDLAGEEFAKALLLDSEHSAARQALGHVRVGDAWLEPGLVASNGPAPAKPPANPANAADPEEAARIALRQADREMVQMLRAEWYKRIRAIRAHYLNDTSKQRFAEGATMLLAIRDPLAVEAMLRLLSDGSAEVRKLLVAAMGGFQTSVATMSLLEAAVLDEDAEVRKAARLQLSRRSDPRILAYLLKSLTSDEREVIRNAADTISYLRLVEAVPALVRELTTKEFRRVPTETVVQTMRQHFIDETGQLRWMEYRRRRTDPFGPAYTTVTVTVFRTEVQEALIELTGENYGFDADAWMAWYRRNVTQRAQPAPAANGPLAPVNP